MHLGFFSLPFHILVILTPFNIFCHLRPLSKCFLAILLPKTHEWSKITSAILKFPRCCRSVFLKTLGSPYLDLAFSSQCLYFLRFASSYAFEVVFSIALAEKGSPKSPDIEVCYAGTTLFNINLLNNFGSSSYSLEDRYA